jgi:transcriptional regulator with XRE-family HTH domain
MLEGGNMQGRPAIREAMARKGLTFRDLAWLTDYSAAYLCRVANGTRWPSKDAALRIAKALQIPARKVAE